MGNQKTLIRNQSGDHSQTFNLNNTSSAKILRKTGAVINKDIASCLDDDLV